MTRKELALCDGREGRAAYVAVNGTVYDFTDSELWQEGNHQGLHHAGADLGAELMQAPHVRAVVARFPVMGNLDQAAPGAGGGTGAAAYTGKKEIELASETKLAFKLSEAVSVTK